VAEPLLLAAKPLSVTAVDCRPAKVAAAVGLAAGQPPIRPRTLSLDCLGFFPVAPP